MGIVTPGQMVWDSIRKQDEQASQQPSSIFSVSVPVSRFLS